MAELGGAGSKLQTGTRSVPMSLILLAQQLLGTHLGQKAEVQEPKIFCESALQVSAYVTCSSILLAKISHMAKPTSITQRNMYLPWKLEKDNLLNVISSTTIRHYALLEKHKVLLLTGLPV